MLYVFDDSANDADLPWLVTMDEEGDDDDKAVARFKEETDAEQFVAMKTEK